MNYIQGNKAAWEEAFEHKHPGWGEENHQRLLRETLPFFCPDVAAELRTMDLRGKTVAQFCCNNGRELLSLMGLGPKSGMGFDIAENIIAQARETAEKAGISNCHFTACSILDIPKEFQNTFDLIFFTIGAITWFEDLMPLFQKVSDCLKAGGTLLVHEAHPIMNMLPLPGEEGFDESHLDKILYSYFKTEPWVESEGMGYMSVQYPSKTFISFSHTLSAIINGISDSGMRVTKFNEYDYDIGLSDAYDGKGFPLSYLLVAKKL